MIPSTPETRSVGSIAEFSRVAGISRHNTIKVLDAFPQATKEGRANLDFARELANRPSSNFEFTGELIMRPAINPAQMGSSIYLNDSVSLEHVRRLGPQELNARHNNIVRWNRIAASRGFEDIDEAGLFFTGFWKCEDDIRNRLVEENGLIVSSCGGFVHQACRVIAWIENIAFEKRKVFLVKPLSTDESKKFKVRIKKPGQQTPDVFNR